MTLGLSTLQKDNLTKLATYLESLPKDYKHFEMTQYLSGAAFESELKYARENGGVSKLGCNTVACAVGHGPAAGVLISDKLLSQAIHTSSMPRIWNMYACEQFCGDDCDVFEFLFGQTWSSNDNHHWGAAARIRYVLAHDAIPLDEDYEGEMSYDTENYAEFRIHVRKPLPVIATAS